MKPKITPILLKELDDYKQHIARAATDVTRRKYAENDRRYYDRMKEGHRDERREQ